MPRYIEGLNECTDPAADDWLWAVDSSAPATDKDRKLSLGKLAVLAQFAPFTQGIGANRIVPATVSVANDAIVALSSWTPTVSGLLFVFDFTGAQAAIFLVQAGANAVVKIAESGPYFSNTVDTAARVNVIYYSSAYRVQNRRGYSANIGVLAIGL